MKKFLNAVLLLLIVALLTVLTQIGGLVLFLSLTTYPFINRRIKHRSLRFLARTGAFLLLYFIACVVIVPPIAKRYGRVPLPVFRSAHVQPLTRWTALLNRHYVKPELRSITFSVAEKMEKTHPGTVINYLDAGFPFLDKFPLIPHLSHHDGKKLDIAFFYRDKAMGTITDQCPSPIGYGGSEYPQKGEPDRPRVCEKQGYWQYSFMARYMPQGKRKLLLFDERRTKDMVNFFAEEKRISKILIEPHLKVRFKLTSNKVRLHGCKAVRHDDHIHVQVY